MESTLVYNRSFRTTGAVVVIGCMLAIASTTIGAAATIEEVAHCRAIPQLAERLKCFKSLKPGPRAKTEDAAPEKKRHAGSSKVKDAARAKQAAREEQAARAKSEQAAPERAAPAKTDEAASAKTSSIEQAAPEQSSTGASSTSEDGATRTSEYGRGRTGDNGDDN